MRHGHIQEIIIQNFRAKKGTAMELSPESPLEDLLWSIACARIIFGPTMNIQAPPNLTPETSSEAPSEASISSRRGLQLNSDQDGGKVTQGGPWDSDLRRGWRALLDAGINDWGGISPVTRDFVNPEKPWPHLGELAEVTAKAGFELMPRLPIYPEFLGMLGEQHRQRLGQLEVLRPATISGPEAHGKWLASGGGSKGIRAAVLRHSDSEGYARGG